MNQSIADLESSVSARFYKLYKEELWEEGLFGPIDGDQFLSFKDYVFSHVSKSNGDYKRLQLETK